MKFYKVIQNNTIIAVLDRLTYCKQQGNGVIVPCSLNRGPSGIFSNDGTPWHLEGCPEFSKGQFDTVKIVEISETEYDELKDALAVDEEVTEPESSEPETVEPAPQQEEPKEQKGEEGEATQKEETEENEGTESVKKQEQVMTVAQMRQRILALEEQVATLAAVNATLTEYHVKASDSSVNTIAKMRGVSSETATEVSEITSGNNGGTGTTQRTGGGETK